MKVSKKACLSAIAAGAMGLGLMGAASQVEAKTYTATMYIAGMGGHFAKAEVVIDPGSNVPIRLLDLTKIDIGDGDTHPVHDARIDVNDRTTMYWSTYKIDSETSTTHVGKTNLLTGEVIQDVAVPTPKQATKTGKMYCASGQTDEYFMPITMSNKAYIDIFNKSDLKRVKTVFLEGTEADIKVPYKYYHGNTSPDMKKLFMAINESKTDHGKTVGKLHMLMLDVPSLIKGKIKVLDRGIAPGAAKKTVSFRQYFSHDGTMIANATGDRMFLVDANNLSNILDTELMPPLEETHDAIFTPDDKYVVLTSRTQALNPGCAETLKRAAPNCEDPNKKKPGPDEFLMDGQLKLYDVKARKVVGRATSVCLACHNEEGLDVHAVLCGLDANFKH
jgi:hypothetical protein